jgi:PhnB protein
VSINLQPDTLAEGKELFDALAAVAQESMPLTAMPWGAHLGTIVDRFGTRWMFNVPAEG